MTERQMESDEPGNGVVVVALAVLMGMAFVIGVFVGAIGMEVTR